MPTLFRPLATAAALFSLLAAPAAHAALVFALAGNGQTLVRFDSATPGIVTTVGSLTTKLDGIDFRPADGLLYGYSGTTNGIYTVNTQTGTTTLLSTSQSPVTTTSLGIDFNPVPDRMRVVTANDENRRINVANGVNGGTGTPPTDGTLAYVSGDTNVGVNPNIVDAAYTNSIFGPIGTVLSTRLYYLDSGTNSLVTTDVPNNGELKTVGLLGFDFDDAAGFDILTEGGMNTAFAQLRTSGNNGNGNGNSTSGLYTINLLTGAATLIGVIGDGRGNLMLSDIAIPVPVPEPGSLALLAVAGLATLTVRRRRAAA